MNGQATPPSTPPPPPHTHTKTDCILCKCPLHLRWQTMNDKDNKTKMATVWYIRWRGALTFLVHQSQGVVSQSWWGNPSQTSATVMSGSYLTQVCNSHVSELLTQVCNSHVLLLPVKWPQSSCWLFCHLVSYLTQVCNSRVRKLFNTSLQQSS